MYESIINLIQKRINNFIIPFLIALVIFFIWFVIIKIIIKSVKNSIYNKYDSIDENNYSKKVADIVWWMLYYTLIIFNILIAFQIVGLNVAILMAWISFGIWFWMEKTLANMFAWIMLVTNPKIKIWEMIYLLWNYNILWRIEKLTARNTVIRLPDQRRLILPNKKVSETPIKTFTQEQIIKDEFTVWVDLNTDIQKAKKIIRNIVNNHPDIIQKEKTFVNVNQITESWIMLKTYFYIYPKAIKKPIFVIKSDLLKEIVKQFNENNIIIPYPYKVVEIKNV